LNTFIYCICELEDGTFVIVADNEMKRWDMTKRTMLQTFKGHSAMIEKVIELKRDVIVSASYDKTVRMWNVSTGECLNVLTQHNASVYGLLKLQDGYFVSGSSDKTIRVWDENQHNIVTYQTKCGTTAMTRLEDGSIVTGDDSLIEIRKSLVFTLFVVTLMSSKL